MRYDTEQIRELQRGIERHLEQLRVLHDRLEWALHDARARAALVAFSSTAGAHTSSIQLTLLLRIEDALLELDSLYTAGLELAEILFRIACDAELTEAELTHLWQCLPRQNLGLLSSPVFADAVRRLSGLADLATATMIGGAQGMIAQAFGSGPGPDVTASVLASSFDLFAAKRTELGVRKQATHHTTAPTTLAELASRVPDAREGAPQVRIERYGSAAQPTWVVYAAGTVSMRPNARGEPWDLTSNLKLMAGQESDSLRGINKAMNAAGVRSTDHVIYVGFSQGGMLAATLAAADRPGQTDLVTFGAPVAQIDLSSVDGAITIEHHEDIVPAFGGPTDGSTDDRALIRESVHATRTGAEENTEALPAHNLDRYAQTAMRLEGALLNSESGQALSIERETILNSLQGTGESALWRVSRD